MAEETTDARTLDNLILEAQLLQHFGIKRSTLDGWRRAGLPCVSMDKTHRAYWRGDVARFLAERRTLGYSEKSE